MREAGLEGVCLSGSGSTLFGFVPAEVSREAVEKKLQEHVQAGGPRVIVTRLRERGRRG
jgi:homoserine kinase